MTPMEVRLEDLLGRRVWARNGRAVGRIEEVRAEARGDEYEVTEYHLGPGALLERLALVNRLLGRQPQTLVVRWDQLDITDPARPQLTCTVDELRKA
jgi:sporulation protein YlmC with PRC-barrel domain